MLRMGKAKEESKSELDFTAADVKAAQARERIRVLERMGNLAALNDYIGFVVSRVLGLLALIAGGLAYVSPRVAPLVMNKPAWIAGAGLALLTGKNVMTLIGKLERAEK